MKIDKKQTSAIRNSSGPNIEPCGTPDGTGVSEDVSPHILFLICQITGDP